MPLGFWNTESRAHHIEVDPIMDGHDLPGSQGPCEDEALVVADADNDVGCVARDQPIDRIQDPLLISF